MKKIIFPVLAVLLAAATVLTVSSCKKDKDEQPEPENPPTYTNGQGEIGSIGGTVMMDDPDSPIDGAKVVIPEGALDENVHVTISEGDKSEIMSNYDTTGVYVKFEPEGIVFNEFVEIHIPYSDQISKPADVRVYYVNDADETIEELTITSIDEANNVAIAETGHFSTFYAGTRFVYMNINLVQDGSDIAARLNVFSRGYSGQDVGVNRILTLLTWYDDGLLNAGDVINWDEPYEVYSIFTVDLKQKNLGFWNDYIETRNFVVRRVYEDGNFGLEIFDDVDLEKMLYSEYNMDNDEWYERYFQGYPLVFKFNHDYDKDKEYYVRVEWSLAGTPNSMAGSRFCPIDKVNTKDDAKKWDDMASYNGDQDGNLIDDAYEEGGGGSNQPPNDPTNESPNDGATNVSINTNLSWTCTDPDGDDLDYDIYFGTSSNPPLEEEFYTSTTWDPGTLEENTTYYWQVKAFEVDNEDHYSESPVWEFTTAEGGGGNTPPTAIFSVSPSSGSTSTTFEFDGSDSYDNEDPTSDLQVRWDFDGDGTWDTGWDYDKTENHQYSAEGTYTAKMEVKDTEGLTDYATQTVTVDNGGGGNGCDGQTTLTYGGQTYDLVEIGDQCWMAENLNYETGNSWCYNNNSSNCDTYGRLYDWSTALGVCPSGWHLPSDDEWKILEGNADTQYGVGDPEWDDTGYRGYDAGKRLKSTSGWYNNGNGTDAFGFAALPGGWRYNFGSFGYIEKYANFWSSTDESGPSAWFRGLDYDYDGVYRNLNHKVDGFSVRCLKD